MAFFFYKTYSYDLLKETIDKIMALVFLVLLSPLLILISCLIFFKLGNPIIFSHSRAGLNGKPFRLFKFRSMTNQCNLEGKLLPPEHRLTDFGIFLRSTSFDEIPSLINVLKGDMSFVGPRPLLLDYLPLYSSEQSLRHSVKPGITGLAQINGRNLISWAERFSLDVKYVRKKSFLIDLKILIKTIWKVFTRKDITPKTDLIMKPFTGNKNIH